MIITFGQGEEAYYGSLVKIPGQFEGPYEVVVSQPEHLRGKVFRLHYDCIAGVEPSFNPERWECINDHLSVKLSRTSSTGFWVRLTDDRTGRIIGHFAGSRFLYFDRVSRAYYAIVAGCHETVSRGALYRHFSLNENSLWIELAPEEPLSVFAEKLQAIRQ